VLPHAETTAAVTATTTIDDGEIACVMRAWSAGLDRCKVRARAAKQPSRVSGDHFPLRAFSAELADVDWNAPPTRGEG
jgi:hypothetical protein